MRYLGLALAVLLALQPMPAAAGAPTEQLKQHVDEVIRVLDDQNTKGHPAQRHAAVRKIAEKIFDYPDTARRSLGRHWASRTPEEQKEFVAIFADLLDRAYLSKIDLYQGEKVRYGAEIGEGDQATVKTTLVTPRGTSVPVDYRMHLVGGRWLVYDVIIEGVSLVANYRTQFNKIVQTESYASLVQKMRAKQAEPAASPRTSPRDR
jgi:phospholipid transport system substrate-binding protein